MTPIGELGSGRLAGHEKGNGESVFRRRPGIILIGGVALTGPVVAGEWTIHGRSELELSRLPELFQYYRQETHVMEDGRNLTLLRLQDADIYVSAAP